MYARHALAAAFAAIVAVTAPGCAVTRGQQTAGAYVDDAAITTAVKSKFVESTQVDAGAISGETLNGTVMLSGVAKNTTERSTAGTLASQVSGVKSVKNEIAVRP